MIRTLLRALVLPGLAGVLLAGCATGYEYRGGPGDYYYGQPEIEYRDQGWYGYGYPYGYYSDGPYGYYGGGYPYYDGGYPYDPYWGGYWVRPRTHHRPDPPVPPSTGVTPPPRPPLPPHWQDRDRDDMHAPRPMGPQRPPVMLPMPPQRNATPRPFIPRDPSERDTHRKTLP
ncbi:MAG: hypothetical protein HOQ02_05505 [Lysobacter sp.]|nr:hypothetical protein [Lysobacter sp.]